MADQIIRLKPLHYIHVHDNNANLTKLVTGPCTHTLLQHESLAPTTTMPQQFVCVPPQHYCIVENPALRDASGALVKEKSGQVKVQLGEKEVRTHQDPFPLYPNEKLGKNVTKLTTLTATTALQLRALRRFDDTDAAGKTVVRQAGDEWLFPGPATYIPRIEVETVELREAIVVKSNESLKLRAKNKFTDCGGVVRQVGEEWLWSRPGAYILGVDETLLSVVPATVLTVKNALHVEVIKAFDDTRPWANKKRLPGQKYLVTAAETSEFTPSPSERVVQEVNLVTLNRKQFAVILDPVGPDGKNMLGRRMVVTNTQLFLKPGESLEAGIQDMYILAEDEALLLTATEEFMDDEVTPPVKRVAGENWLLKGPREFIPRATVQVVHDDDGAKRPTLVLAANEGVYVRNMMTGEVRAVIGGTYMLSAVEELWEKELPAIVEKRLALQGLSHASYIEKGGQSARGRDRTRVVTYEIPNNSVTQVYDYKKRTQRTVFGPDKVLLGPDEQFTVLSLSGSDWDPKRPNICLPKKTGAIKALYMFLGPATLSDVIQVETADHARLALQLSYDWHFDVAPGNTKEADECFTVPDFVGDCCSCIASRVRASIAGIPFDHFHRNSSMVVKTAVFGVDGKSIRSVLRFPSNRLVVTSVDIQEIEVLDAKTKEALQQSVKMAIEITTKAQETASRQEASVRQQQAKGKLERQMIEDRGAAEVERKKLLEQETACAAVESTGQAKAEARARAEAAEIEGLKSVEVAKVGAQARQALEKTQLEMKLSAQQTELAHQAAMNDLEVSHSKGMSEVEAGKFQQTINAVGQNTVKDLARAGPEMQARLLKGLGLEGYLVTDGTNPINLFNTAKGMVNAAHADPAAGTK